MKSANSLTVLAVVTGTVLTSGAASAMPAFDASTLRGNGLIEQARIVCEPFGRCFRIDRFGRRIFVPRPEGFGRPGFVPGFGLGRPGFDGRDGDRRPGGPGFGDDERGPAGGRRQRPDQDGFQPQQGAGQRQQPGNGQRRQPEGEPPRVGGGQNQPGVVPQGGGQQGVGNGQRRPQAQGAQQGQGQGSGQQGQGQRRQRPPQPQDGGDQ